MITAKKTHHVVRNPDGGWDIKKGGASRTSGHYRTQRDAIGAARKISLNQHSELYIHARDGRIRTKDNYSKVPHPLKG